MHDWASAIRMYGEVSSSGPGQDEQMMLEARTRECDLHQAMGDYAAAQECWEEGLRRWSANALMHNELGNVHVQLGNLELAGEYYESALHHGMDLAELNIAIVRELEGRTAESVRRFESVLARTRAAGLPDTHIRIKMATVLPRVMPALPELQRFRRRFEDSLDELLGRQLEHVDNSEPTKMGYSLGLHLAYHGENNVGLKTKLHRVYSLFCPSLLTGAFLSQDQIILQVRMAWPYLPLSSQSVISPSCLH